MNCPDAKCAGINEVVWLSPSPVAMSAFLSMVLNLGVRPRAYTPT